MTWTKQLFAAVLLASLARLANAKDVPDPAKSAPNQPVAEKDDQRDPIALPGMTLSGATLLPNGWSLRPAGKQIKLGDFPVNIAVHPRQPYAAVLHSGYGEHEISIVDLERLRVVSRVILDQTFYGLAFGPRGARLYASGAEHEVIHQFTFADGFLTEHRELPVGDSKDKLVPIGLAASEDYQSLYVCCGWGGTVCVLPIEKPQAREHLPMPKGSYPYMPLLSKDGKRLYVSLWAAAGVAVIDLATKKIEATWPTDAHPTEMVLSPDGTLLYVACANSNAVNVIDVATGKTIESIASSLHPQSPPGSTPNSLALTPDGKALYIANADNNNLALFNVSERGKSTSLGFIPAGWYPTSVRVLGDGKILVANGKGLSSFPNPRGPNPDKAPPATTQQYIGGLMNGTPSVNGPPSPPQMARYTKQA